MAIETETPNVIIIPSSWCGLNTLGYLSIKQHLLDHSPD